MLINGELKGYIYGKRGLRKEGPLSPYLFLLVMEAFTALFQKKSEDDGLSSTQGVAVSVFPTSFLLMICLSCVGQRLSPFRLVASSLSEFLLFLWAST